MPEPTFQPYVSVPPQPGEPPRKRRRGLKAFLIGGGVFVALIVLVSIAATAGDPGGNATPAAQASASTASKTTADPCAKYPDTTAHDACADGQVALADRTQAKVDCTLKFTNATALDKCIAGDNAGATAAQTAADVAAAEAAEAAANRGKTYDNPLARDTHTPMQSTNRLDGSTAEYQEWFDGYNNDWRGYDEFEAPDAGYKYVAVTVHVKATTAGVDASSVKYDVNFADAKGTAYEQASVYGYAGEMPDVTLGAGQQASGVVVFQVPVGLNGGVVSFGQGSIFAAL
jgi:hypothetical protein